MSRKELPEARLLIGGSPCPAVTGETREVRSPATGDVVGRVAQAAAGDVDRAVQAAHEAFQAWSQRTAYEREATIRKATAFVRTRAQEIGTLMALEQGKPLNQSRSEVTSSCDLVDFYAAEAVRVTGQVLPTEKQDFRSWVIHQPVGVAAMITPWNYPVSLLCWKLGPALAAGCTAVVKPSPAAPLSPAAFVHALAEGGLPPGVVSVLTGEGAALGEALVSHPLVKKVAMTGSTATGKEIMKRVGSSLKHITLELGGHCPAIVCEDADLDLTAEALAYKAFRNMGQSCSAINRVYAHISVHDTLVSKLADRAKKLTIGDGVTDGGVDLGPMTTAEVLEKVKRHVADAVKNGARLVYGGKAPEGTAYAQGHYYLPTILTGLTPDMLMAREETFGPVAPFAAFNELDEAVRLANDTPYGLVSFIFTRNLTTAWKLSERLEAGTVCINNVAVNTGYGPYQGWKDSGFGLELSREAIYEYLNVKHIKARL